jgi:hypothetical protein
VTILHDAVAGLTDPRPRSVGLSSQLARGYATRMHWPPFGQSGVIV